MEISGISSVAGTFSQMQVNNINKEPPDIKEISEQMSGRLIKGLDKNGDGMLSADEVEFDEELFQDMDSDKDGLLSQKELKTGIENNEDRLKDILPPPPTAEGEGLEGLELGGEFGKQKAVSAYQDNLDALLSSLFDSVGEDEEQYTYESLNIAV
ncbi:MAG: hypothetical protein JW718_03800 [Desulfovibrionaceae bacterium]|nr:hypothetical protein [Desulfovibrionaceae bacterium]